MNAQIPTSEVLNRAADIIEERGWTQVVGWGDSSREDETSPLCIEGGILAASGLGRRFAMYAACPAYRAVVDYLGLTPLPASAPIVGAPWQWNDAPGRTQAEVIEVLRACAVIEASHEREAAEVSA